MADLNGFDADLVEPSDFGPVPEGQYQAVITKSEMKPTKAGTGEYLELEFEIVGQEYLGRKLWERLNLTNPNEIAVRIAQETLSKICRAVNIRQPNDSSDLHNIPMVIYVVCRKREDTGEMANEIKKYLPYLPSVDPPPTAGESDPAPWN